MSLVHSCQRTRGYNACVLPVRWRQHIALQTACDCRKGGLQGRAGCVMRLRQAGSSTAGVLKMCLLFLTWGYPLDCSRCMMCVHCFAMLQVRLHPGALCLLTVHARLLSAVKQTTYVTCVVKRRESRTPEMWAGHMAAAKVGHPTSQCN